MSDYDVLVVVAGDAACAAAVSARQSGAKRVLIPEMELPRPPGPVLTSGLHGRGNSRHINS